jgi:hypothetical protein
MTRKALADAFNKLAEAAAIVAIELEADEQPGPPAAAGGGASSPSPAGDEPTRLPPKRTEEESAFTMRPAHKREWIEGRYGKYCTGASDDPDWSNAKGYCNITPRSAGAWVRKHAA